MPLGVNGKICGCLRWVNELQAMVPLHPVLVDTMLYRLKFLTGVATFVRFQTRESFELPRKTTSVSLKVFRGLISLQK